MVETTTNATLGIQQFLLHIRQLDRTIYPLRHFNQKTMSVDGSGSASTITELLSELDDYWTLIAQYEAYRGADVIKFASGGLVAQEIPFNTEPQALDHCLVASKESLLSVLYDGYSQ